MHNPLREGCRLGQLAAVRRPPDCGNQLNNRSTLEKLYLHSFFTPSKDAAR
jgi:hypothetical protein